VFTARYELNPYTNQIRFVFKGLNKEKRKGQKCFFTRTNMNIQSHVTNNKLMRVCVCVRACVHARVCVC
jgi:hypothetical protein